MKHEQSNLNFSCFGALSLFAAMVVKVSGLKLLQVSIPPLRLTGQSARLACLYDLEGDALYSVKWLVGIRLVLVFYFSCLSFYFLNCPIWWIKAPLLLHHSSSNFAFSYPTRITIAWNFKSSWNNHVAKSTGCVDSVLYHSNVLPRFHFSLPLGLFYITFSSERKTISFLLFKND